ncbi:MAG TPA: MFS transporter [Opitutaceae bacterium]
MNRTVIGIGLASLFSDLGHEMATTAMPGFLLSIGAGSAVLGLVEGLSDGFSSFAKLLSGLYGDRLRRRKPLAAAGYLVTAAGMASFAFATQWWHVLAARIIGWTGRGVRTPIRKVLLAEATTPETRGRAFGLERAMDSAGAVVGPLLSVALVGAVGMRRTFALTIIPGMIAALLIAVLVREREHPPRPEARLWAGIAALPASFRRYLLGIGIAGMGDFSKTLLILWAAQAWTPRFGAARAAVLAMAFYAGYNVVYSLSCLVSGVLADRLPRQAVLAWGYAAAVIPACLLLLPGGSLAKFAAVFGFSGLYMGVWETVESATAAALLSPQERGTGFGVLSTVNGLGDLVSSAAVGALWAISPFAAMVFVAVTAVAGSCIIAGTGRPAARGPLEGAA